MSTYTDQDLKLQKELYQKVGKKTTYTYQSHAFRNQTLHQAVIHSTSPQNIFRVLEKNETFNFNTETIKWQDTDGETRELTINRASKTDMWPMGTNYWVRDNALIASSLLNLDYTKNIFPQEWFLLGKNLLLSCLTIMSSTAQLERFASIIDGSKSYTEAIHWPHIFLSIKDNLNAAHDEAWMHKQDAWQILCYIALDALEKKLITEDELTSKHTQLLHSICPFLNAVQFTQTDNAGSWEEITAIRTSVISWETALLHKVTQSKTFSHPDAESLFQQGLQTLKNNFPHESPNYPAKDTRYRSADAALLYPLLIELYLHFPEAEQPNIIDSLLSQIESLIGPYGINRYQGDSYQGLSYYTNSVSSQLRDLYQSPSGDSSDESQFLHRAAIVPPGHEAQWTHFVWQLSSAYSKLCKNFPNNPTYPIKQNHYFLKGLSLITGEDEWTLTETNHHTMQVSSVPSFRIPECYNSEIYNTHIFQYPSLHTPLYWSVAECISAFNHRL